MPAPRTQNCRGATRAFDAGPVLTRARRKAKPRDERMVILENLDFSWRRSDMDRAVKMWQAGTPLVEMAAQLGREQDEVLLLVVHLARRGRIGSRAGGLMGTNHGGGVNG